MSNRQSRRNGSGGNLSWLKQQWFQLTATSLITTVVSVGAAFLFDHFGPVNPQVEKQIEQLEKSIQKDEWFITLAQELTGKVDTQTVERVKKEVVAYLGRALGNYPTRDEFAREKHRYIDKEKGVVWESRMEDGRMFLMAVESYTNQMEKANGK